jgi:hypothetical protein
MPRTPRAKLGLAAVVLVGASLAGMEAAAAPWVRIFPDNEYAVFDSGSVRRDGNGVTRVLVSVGGPPFEIFIRCSDRTYVTRSDLESGRPFAPPNPGTIPAGLVARMCR